jgi:hypothetical protein
MLDADAKSVMVPLVEALRRSERQAVNDARAAARQAFDPWRQLAKQATQEQKESAKEAALASKLRVAAEKAAAKEAAAAAKRAASEASAAEKQRTRELEQETRRRDGIVRRSSEMAGRLAAKQAAEEKRGRERAARDAARESDRAQRTALANYGAPLARGAFSAGAAALRFGASAMKDIARGAGIDFDFSRAVATNVGLQQSAVDLSNSGFMPGTAGANGIRQDPKALRDEVMRVATETGLDPTQAMEGLRAFVGKTGDLETGRAVLRDMGVLSKATGTNFEDMLDAAGDVSTQLGDIPDKGKTVQSVMQSIAGQGKLGAVEVRDLATQMAKIAAAAPQFAGDTAENIALMGALAQEAKQHGGAPSAASAATSVTSFVNTFTKSARAREFAAAGVDIYERDATGQKTGRIRNAQDIIVDSIRKTNADDRLYGKLFADTRSQSVVKGFAKIYRDAGGGEAGVAAVNEEFDRLKRAAMGAGETMDSFAAAMNTDASKAQVLNNRFTEASDGLKTAFMPAVISAATALTDVATQASGWFQGLFGDKRTDENREGLQAILESQNTNAEVHRKFRAGTATQNDVAKLKANRVKLVTEAGRASAELNEAEHSEDNGFTGGALGDLGSFAAGTGTLDFALGLLGYGDSDAKKARVSAAKVRLRNARGALHDNNTELGLIDGSSPFGIEANTAQIRRGNVLGHDLLGEGNGGPFGLFGGAANQLPGTAAAPEKTDPVSQLRQALEAQGQKNAEMLANTLAGKELSVRVVNAKEIGGGKGGGPTVGGDGRTTDNGSGT